MVVRIIEIIMGKVAKSIIQEVVMSTQIVIIMIETIMTTGTAIVVIVIMQNLVNMLSLITTDHHGKTILIRTICHQSLVNIRRNIHLIGLIDRETQRRFQQREVTAQVSLLIGNAKNNQSL